MYIVFFFFLAIFNQYLNAYYIYTCIYIFVYDMQCHVSAATYMYGATDDMA